MRWDDLNMGDKSRMIKLAVDSGITDLRTIRDVYNSYAEGGQKERRPISNKLLKDIAYKIGTNDAVQSRGSANILDIVKAVLGKNPPKDDNKYAYIYGTGDRYPEVKEPIKGFDYSKYLNKYGYEGVKNVYGTINPTKEYHIDEEYENLAKELAKHNYHFYDDADDMFLDYDPDVLGYRDDVANFIHQLSLDENNNVVVHDSDVYDFNPVDYEYAGTVARPLMKLEASLMDRIGTPYIIRQENQPLYFDGALRGSWNIQQHLEDLSDEDIARITGSGLIEPAFIEGEHPDPDFDPYDFAAGGKIHIKPENRGKFTALKKRTGHSASWFKAHGTPAQRKMATFALNARKWKHGDGGTLFEMGGGIFGRKPIPLGELPEVEITSSKNAEQGAYLPEEYRQFFSNYSNYNDYKSKAEVPEDQAGLAEAMAQYYYNNNPTYQDYFKFSSGPYNAYQKLREEYTRSGDYMVDMTKGDTYRLKSIDAEGKPTNKHTMKVNEGLLDYLYKEAKRGGVDPKEAIALAVNESNLGNSRQTDGKVGVFDLLSYWAGTGAVLYPNSKTIDPYNRISAKIRNGEKLTAEDRKTIQELHKTYSKMAESIHPYEGKNVVADAVKYFNAGKYPGLSVPQERIDAYRQTVMGRFDELMNDPRFVKWWNSKK